MDFRPGFQRHYDPVEIDIARVEQCIGPSK